MSPVNPYPANREFDLHDNRKYNHGLGDVNEPHGKRLHFHPFDKESRLGMRKMGKRMEKKGFG